MNEVRSKSHGIGAYEINKSSLSCFDDKIYIKNNGYDGLALKTVILITIKKSFFSSILF